MVKSTKNNESSSDNNQNQNITLRCVRMKRANVVLKETAATGGADLATPTPENNDNKKDTNESKIIAIISEELGVNSSEITVNSSFIDDLGADSLDTIGLIMAVEDAFNITIPEDSAEGITHVQNLIDYIAKNT